MEMVEVTLQGGIANQGWAAIGVVSDGTFLGSGGLMPAKREAPQNLIAKD
jgi:hypothetical protein